MNDTEYRERCRELEKNIHMLEFEVNVLNNECENLSALKEKSRNSLQMSSFGNNLHIAKLNGRICGAKRPHSVSEQPNFYQSM